jgi:RNA polymerase sigma-70 factor, ECF subfamily
MEEAFERIVREYQDRIYRLALSIMGEPAAAEEAAQDALVRIWKGLGGFRAEAQLSTWIYAITRNACLTALGRRGPKAVSLEEASALREAETRGNGWVRHRSTGAADLLDRLPAKYRQVATLFYMQEKSYDEVALMLGLPVGTVKTYLFRARKTLAEAMAHERTAKGGR